MNDKKTPTTIWVIALAFMSNSVVTKPMATMSDSLGSIWVMDVFLIYKWWCVWHPPEVWVNPSGPYKWSLNADYQSERWLWFLALMSVGSYLGIKLNDDSLASDWMLFPWHLPEWSLSYCNPDEWWLQTWLYLTYDWMLDIHMGVACFLNFWEMCDWGVTKPMATMSDSLESMSNGCFFDIQVMVCMASTWSLSESKWSI